MTGPGRKKAAMPLGGVTAKDGEHFFTFREGNKTNFVCKIFPYVDVFATSKAYHNHALVKHALFQARVEKKKPDTSRKKDMPKATSGTKRKGTNSENPTKGEPSIFCFDYLRLRGDSPVRWRETKTGKKAGFHAKSVRYFELLYGPEPPMPETDLYIEVLERALPIMGHSGWECLLDDKIYAELHKSIRQSARTNSVYDWSTAVEDSMEPDVPKEQPLEIQLVWLKSKSFCRALRHLFKKIDWEDPHNRTKAYPVRELFANAATKWIERTRSRLVWFQNTSEDKIKARAQAAYDLWKKTNKQGILDTQRQNLFYTLTTHFKRSTDEAIAQGMPEVPIIDSSDPEDAPIPSVPPFKYRFQVNEKSQHVDEVHLSELQNTTSEIIENPVAPVCTGQVVSEPSRKGNTVTTIVPDSEESDGEDDAFMPQKRKTTSTSQSCPSHPSNSSGNQIQPAPQPTIHPGVVVAHSSSIEAEVGIPVGRRKQGKLRRKRQTKNHESVAVLECAPHLPETIQGVIVAEEDDSPVDFHKTLHVPETLDTPLDLHFMSQFDSIE